MLTWALAVNDPPRGFGPGIEGFIVLFLLAVACYLLFRSMVGHLRTVRYSKDPAKDPTDVGGEAGGQAGGQVGGQAGGQVEESTGPAVRTTPAEGATLDGPSAKG